MEPDWNHYIGVVDDQSASFFLDMSFEDVAPLASHPKVVWLSLTMRAPNDDGLSSSEEFQTLSDIENALSETAQTVEALLVGSVTHAGMRDLFFYVKQRPNRFWRKPTIPLEDLLQEAMGGFPDYTFDIGARADANWSVFWTYLYPEPAQRQQMLSNVLLAVRIEQDDDFAKVREIDHAAVFEEEAMAREFADWAVAAGYTLVAINEREGKIWVELLKSGTLEAIHSEVDELFKAATTRGGIYDGWGALIVP